MKPQNFLMTVLFLISSYGYSADMTFVGQEYPPFNWKEGDEIKGGMYEVVKKACEKLQHTCKFDMMPLSRALKMMETGELDGVLTLTPNADRAVYSNFSQLLIASHLTYLGKKGTKQKLNSIKDLEGWTVGAVRSASSTKKVLEHKEEVKNLTVIQESNNDILVKKVDNDRYGEKGAIAGAEDMLKFVAKKNQIELETILIVENQNFMTAFSKKKVDLATYNAFKKTFSEMKKSGELKTILEKYSLKAYEGKD